MLLGGLPAWAAGFGGLRLAVEQIDWNSATLHVRRVKSGKPRTHPIRGDELLGAAQAPAGRTEITVHFRE